MSVNIREISDRKGLRRFVRFPFDLYRGNEFWVPPLIGSELKNLDAQTNPAFSFLRGRLWVAENEAGRIQGRVAAFFPKKIDRSGAPGELPPARFGYLDFVDDPEVARALLGEVERWAREEGLVKLEGPYGVTTFDTSAVLVEGYDELPTAASSYNYPYYGPRLEECGFEKEVDYLEFELPDVSVPHKRIAKLARFTMKKKPVHLVEVKTRKDILRHAPEAFALINEAYSDLHGFEPLTDEQVAFYTDIYFSFLDPAFVKILADDDGRMVAFGVSMPSLSKGLQAARGRLFPFGFLKLLKAMKTTETVDLYLVAVRQEWKNAGLPSILMHETNVAASARGMRRVETNGELETNETVQALWKLYNARQHKRRRVYRKLLA